MTRHPELPFVCVYSHHSQPNVCGCYSTDSLCHVLFFLQQCRDRCLPGQFINGSCNGLGIFDGVGCGDCRTSCEPGFFLEGACTGKDTVDTTECYPCQAGKFSVRSGSGPSSCQLCPVDSYSDPGSSSCVTVSRGWPLRGNANEYAGGNSLSARRAGGITFVSNIQGQNRLHSGVAKFDGDSSRYITAQDDGCSNLPVEQLSISLWVRMDQRKWSGFASCFLNSQQGAMGWFIGTSASGSSFAYSLRSSSASTATLLTDLSFRIVLGTW
jgi:hypothetical protein